MSVLGGTDTLWAQLLLKNGQLSGWQQFTVTAPVARVPTLTVKNDANATRGQGIESVHSGFDHRPGRCRLSEARAVGLERQRCGGQFVVNG